MIAPRTLLLIITCGFAAANSLAAAQSGWVDLINGKDLSNWEQRGGKSALRS